MLSSKLLLLLIGSIAISSCLATEEDWGLDGEAQEVSKKAQDIADNDDDDNDNDDWGLDGEAQKVGRKVQDIADNDVGDDDDDDIFAMEEDDYNNINELLRRELSHNVAKGQWRRWGRWSRRACRRVIRACNWVKKTFGIFSFKARLVCKGVRVACRFG